jgi:hypothetical protein
MDERGWPAVTPFLAAQRVRYPVLLGSPKHARAYGGLQTLPFTVFIEAGPSPSRRAAAHDVD